MKKYLFVFIGLVIGLAALAQDHPEIPWNLKARLNSY